jgi:hypothetical protein
MSDDDNDGGLRWWAEVGQYEQDRQYQPNEQKEINREVREGSEKESQATAGADWPKRVG